MRFFTVLFMLFVLLPYASCPKSFGGEEDGLTKLFKTLHKGSVKGAWKAAQAIRRKLYAHEKQLLRKAEALFAKKNKTEAEELELRITIGVLGRIGSGGTPRILRKYISYTPNLPIIQLREAVVRDYYPCSGALIDVGLPSLLYLLEILMKEDDELTVALARYCLSSIGKSTYAFYGRDRPMGDLFAKAYLELVIKSKSIKNKDHRRRLQQSIDFFANRIKTVPPGAEVRFSLDCLPKQRGRP